MTHKHDLPESMKRAFRSKLLKQTRFDDGLPILELSLCEWYLRENSILIDKMLADERAYVDEQIRRGDGCPNDSDIVAAEYHTKRIRYADVVYLCSLIETFLKRACEKLDFILDDGSASFELKRGKSKWLKCQQYLKTRGSVSVPAGMGNTSTCQSPAQLDRT